MHCGKLCGGEIHDHRVEEIQTDDDEFVIHNLHVVCQKQRADCRRQQAEHQDGAPFEKEMGKKKHEREIADRHELRPMPFGGQTHGIRTEHERQCRDKGRRAGELQDAKQKEHRNAAEQEIDDIPRPPPVQIEQVKNLLNVFLDIIDIVGKKGDRSECRHSAKKIRHPENVGVFGLGKRYPCVCIADCVGGVSAGCEGGIVKDDAAEKHKRHDVQKGDTQEILHGGRERG